MNPYLPKKVRIVRAEKLTADTNLLRVRAWMKYNPGQFLQVSLLGYGECPISICSYSRIYADLCIKAVGNVTNKLIELKKGDKLFIRGPYGNGYPMHELKGKNIVLVGGGTGVAPLRSVIEFLKTRRKNFGKVSIFFGFRTINDTLFKNEFEEWQKKYDFHVSLDKACKEWKGKVCLVTEPVKEAHINKDSVAIICGPPIMIKFLAPILNEKGISNNNIFVSLERHMKCGIGKCGRCMTHGKRVCINGPVFSYDQVKGVVE